MSKPMTAPVCAPIDGVEDAFVETMVKQAMAAEFAAATGMTIAETWPHVEATFESGAIDEPITIEGAVQAVRDELEYWGEE